MQRRPRLLLVVLATVVGVLACGPDLLGPGGARPGAVQLNPAFPLVRVDGREQPLSVGAIVSFARVRIVLLRANGDTVLNRVVDFPAESASLSLAFPVTLDPTAPLAGETLAASLRFISATGDTVFRGGPVNVLAAPPTSSPPPPPEIPLTYTGLGANAASVAISPASRTARTGETIAFTATARDAQGTAIPGTPVAFSSLDTTKVRVGLTSGSAQVTGFRGTATVVAQTVTGQRDSALVTIIPTPTAIAVVAGNNQQVVQQRPFPAAVRVQVAAGDGLPVAGEVVAFTVTAGQGTVSQARDTTDATGIAEVTWTAGAVSGPATLQAQVLGAPTTIAVLVSGTQLTPPPPAQLRFAQLPRAVTAGDTLPTLSVVLLDAAGDTARAYTGPIRVAIDTGPSGIVLTGPSVVAAANGTARFPGLRLTGAGLYRLVARADSIAGLTSAPTDTFTVRPGAAATLRLTGRTAQVAGDTQTVRITALDTFGNQATGLQGAVSLVVKACQASATGEIRTGQTAVAWNTSATPLFSAGVTDLIVRPFTAGAYDLCAGLTASLVTSGVGQRLSLSVAPAVPTHFRLTAPASWTAGVPQTVTLTAYDDFENVATGLSSIVTSVLFSGPTTSPTGAVPTMTYVGGTAVPLTNNASLAFTSGIATSTLTLVAQEGTSLSAVAHPPTGVITTRPADVIPVTVTAAPTQALAVATAPAGAYNGTAFLTQPVVRAVDTFGNPTGQGGVAVTAVIASGTGTLGGTVTRPTTAGTGAVAFTDLGITGGGTHSLRFGTTGAVLPAVSAPFQVEPVSLGVRLHAGASDRTSATVGTDLLIPLLVDLSNRGGEDLASLTAYVAWDTTQFTYIGSTPGTWVDDAGGSASVFLNTANTVAGQLVISGFTANATTTSFVLRTLTLRPRAAGTAMVNVATGASGNAAGGSLTVVVRPLSVSIVP